MRVDIWDVKKPEELAPLDIGYPRDFDDLFTVDRVIGKGGFGLVKIVLEKSSGLEFACKSIKKRLDIPNISPEKQAQHLDNIDREAKILKRLRGTLSVVHFKGAWEDDTDVHLVMEYCRGGELHHSIGLRMYTEATVASYIRSVLHTLAQCHSHRILHRDIKPGNFMLLTEAENSPLKAIDFGLAAFYEPEQLPRTDLGLDGTPWFMAPEVLNSQTYPASDVWSAGVMAYQLLSGYLPFDDVRNPNNPALSVIWRGILTEEPSFRRSAWQEVSAEAKDFIKLLLDKDHEKRPSAKEALKHPWLQTTFHAGKKRPLSATVVQRIQRFAQTNVLRRTILELMANELLKMAPPRLLDPSMRGGIGAAAAAAAAVAAVGGGEMATSPDGSDGPAGTVSSQDDSSSHGGAVFPMSPEKSSMLSGEGGGGGIAIRRTHSGSGRGSLDLSGHGGRSFGRSPSMQQIATLARAAARTRGAATVHGPGDYWRIMRQASELAAIGSGHGQMNYLRVAPRSEQERMEQRKAARLSLDTSAHGGGRFAEFMAKLEAEGSHHLRHKMSSGMRASASMGSLRHDGSFGSESAPAGTGMLSAAMETSSRSGDDGAAVGRLPSQPLFPLPETTAVVPPLSDDGPAPMDEDTMEKGGRGRSLAFLALQAEGGGGGGSEAVSSSGASASKPNTSAASPAGIGEVRTVKRVSFNPTPAYGSTSTAPPLQPPVTEQIIPSIDARGTIAPSDGSIRRSISHSGPVTNPQELEGLMRKLKFKTDRALDKESLAEGLRQLGYDLDPSEMAVLLDQLDLDADQSVAPAEFVASQLDWGALQRNNRDLWLECARRAFADLDSNSDGRLTAQELVASLRSKLPAEEVDFAVEDAMVEVGGVDADEIDFEGFLKMLRVGSFESLDSLDQYDDRMRRTALESMDSSLHGGILSPFKLETVPEDTAPPK